jgi:hypothetical protein
MRSPIDPGIANASLVASTRVEAGSGLSFNSPDPVLLPKGTALCRIGHRSVRRQAVPEADNFMSPWWILRSDFSKILALGQRDPSWAARVSLAIAEQWGGDCRLQVQASLGEPLYAWAGPGRAISGNRCARAVPANDPRGLLVSRHIHHPTLYSRLEIHATRSRWCTLVYGAPAAPVATSADCGKSDQSSERSTLRRQGGAGTRASTRYSVAARSISPRAC